MSVAAGSGGGSQPTNTADALLDIMSSAVFWVSKEEALAAKTCKCIVGGARALQGSHATASFRVPPGAAPRSTQ